MAHEKPNTETKEMFMTQHEVAMELGISRSMVHQIGKAALEKMRARILRKIKVLKWEELCNY